MSTGTQPPPGRRHLRTVGAVGAAGMRDGRPRVEEEGQGNEGARVISEPEMSGEEPDQEQEQVVVIGRAGFTGGGEARGNGTGIGTGIGTETGTGTGAGPG